MCRSEKSAGSNEGLLSQRRSVNMAFKGEHHRQQKIQRPSNKEPGETCRKCGYTVPHKGNIFLAKGQKCNRCGGEDHFSRVCGKNKE
ncbi:hypothetical protein DAPPUDRAFT_251101 [Daphnia pulex]|uniref:Uncharacterized protein n=1 Tax=Daphnia pulex TaxID=6669 RepID=E9GZR7_DAPPU|nr:hypothetical protein DAPPUDRAFT_251101 [Daphnia pulex]|eukprot:EFX75041.1 hypothetical protein DAPPUDRAFT_251101 [Daphnia pulex]